MSQIGKLTHEELVTLAGALDTPAGRVCVKIMALEEAHWASKRDTDPLLNTEHVHDDMRYVLGTVLGTQSLSAAINEARKRLGNRAEGGEA